VRSRRLKRKAERLAVEDMMVVGECDHEVVVEELGIRLQAMLGIRLQAMLGIRLQAMLGIGLY
jgi:hypothetical protein